MPMKNFYIRENQYELIPMTNALMVVILEVTVTKLSKRFPRLIVMALGAFIYAGGVTLVSLTSGFLGF
jgi:hypothetical protein